MKRSAILLIVGLAVAASVYGTRSFRAGSDYELTASVTLGGGKSTGGEFELHASIGESNAGAMAGGNYTLTVGFLAAVTPVGCGACTLHGDVFPFDGGDPDGNPVGNCVNDIDDVLTLLSSFSAADHCAGFPNGVNTFPCDELCTAGTVDIDDILAALSAFSGTFGCPHPCAGGACCFGDSTCQDWDGIGAGTTPIGGMSETTCGQAGGAYQGDGTTCDTVTCP